MLRSIFLTALLLTSSFAAPAAELKLRILQTSDLHMNLLNYDYYQDRVTDEFGLAKTISLINAARDERPNNLLFDNGDLLQGSPLGELVARIKPQAKGEIHPAYKVLNLLRVDAANLGNHEFNFGLPFLREAIAGANFPYVNANVMLAAAPGQASRHAFTPYVLLERSFKDEAGQPQRLKIGVIGLTPPQIMLWDRPHLEGRVYTRDMVEVARELIPQLRAKGADLIIAIAHTGIEKSPQPNMAENRAADLARLSGPGGLDALLLGHAHSEFPSELFAGYPGVDLVRGSLHGMAMVMPGRWGDHLGLIDLTLNKNASGNWQVTDSRAELRAIYRRSDQTALVAADPLVAHVIRREHADTLAQMRAPVASISAPIHSYFAQVRDDPSVELVARAQLAYMQRAVQGSELAKLPMLSAASPFKAGGRQGWSNYTDIAAGAIAAKHVADLYLYPNTLVALKLSGAEVREWLEMAAGQFRRIDPAGPAQQQLLDEAFRSFNFDSIEGLTYEIDITQAARYDADGRRSGSDARRIVNLQYRGSPLDEAMQFLVVTNSYRANGGGNFPGLNAGKIAVETPDETRQALSQYLSQAGHFKPAADANWRIRPVPGVALRFVSGAGGIAHLGDAGSVKLIETRADGSALFELTP